MPPRSKSSAEADPRRKNRRPRLRSRCARETCAASPFPRKPGKPAIFPWSEKLAPLVSRPMRPKLIGHDLKPGVRAWHAAFRRTMRLEDRRSSSTPRSPTRSSFPICGTRSNIVAESLLGYTPMAAPAATSASRIFSPRWNRPTPTQLSARRAMERADLALQLHAALAPKLDESGAGTSLLRNRVAAAAGARRDGKRRHPARPGRAGGSRAKNCAPNMARLEASIYHARGRAVQHRLAQAARRNPLRQTRADARTRRKPRPASTPPTSRPSPRSRRCIRSSREVLEHREASKLLSTYIDRAARRRLAADGRIHTTFQPTRHQHRPAQFAGPQSAEHPDPHRAGPRNPPRLRPARRRATRCSPPTIRRSSCASSPRSRRTPACSRRSPAARTSIAPPRRKSSACRSTEVTKDQRNQAKMVNYGISYGISAFGLSQRLGIPRADAKNAHRRLFRAVPRHQALHDRDGRARAANAATSRPSPAAAVTCPTSAPPTPPCAPPPSATPSTCRSRAPRADLIKIAMVQIAQVAREENWRTKLLLQVHDELVFDLYLPEKERVLEVVQDRDEKRAARTQGPDRGRDRPRRELARGALIPAEGSAWRSTPAGLQFPSS